MTSAVIASATAEAARHNASSRAGSMTRPSIRAHSTPCSISTWTPSGTVTGGPVRTGAAGIASRRLKDRVNAAWTGSRWP